MNTGTAGTGNANVTGARIVKAPVNTSPTLSDMGISYSLSSRAQVIAAVPEEEFEQAINEHIEQQEVSAMRQTEANEQQIPTTPSVTI